MCARYSISATPDLIRKNFPFVVFNETPDKRYNVAPSQNVPIVKADGNNALTLGRWGLIPAWAKSIEAQKIRPVNAKLETIAESRMFAPLLRRQRCILIADGFFEWETIGKMKIPHYFRLRSREPFAFAGVYDIWHDELTTCALITGEPNEIVGKIHNRMPMMLDAERAQHWLEPNGSQLAEQLAMLKPYPAELMETFRVSPEVNKPKNDRPEVLEPAVAGIDEPFF